MRHLMSPLDLTVEELDNILNLTLQPHGLIWYVYLAHRIM